MDAQQLRCFGRHLTQTLGVKKTMRNIYQIFSICLLVLVAPIAQADYSVDIVHYLCKPKEQKLEVWYEQLMNQQGTYFDGENEGAYDPSKLVDWNSENYRQSTPSKDSPVVKTCMLGKYEIRLEIHPGSICQDGALPKIKVFSKKNKLYESKAFGTTCSGAASVGPEVDQKITVTPRRVEIQSGLWFW